MVDILNSQEEKILRGVPLLGAVRPPFDGSKFRRAVAFGCAAAL
jgi:hypothetical protein